MPVNIIFLLLMTFLLTACTKKEQQQKPLLQTESTDKSFDQTVTDKDREETDEDETSQREKERPYIEHNDTDSKDTQDINTSWIDGSVITDDSVTESNISYPHIAPDPRNITEEIFDPSFEKESLYISFEGAGYDTEIKRTGKRSVRFSSRNDTMFINSIPVEEGKWYVISGYMFVKSLPADVMRYYVQFMNETKAIDIPNYPVVGISKTNSWEEFVLPVYIKKDLNVTHVRFVLRDTGEMNTSVTDDGDVWIDDLSMHEVNGSGELFGLTAPSVKRRFEGALVEVDGLGNFSLKDENGSKPFFPVIVYPEAKSDNWKKYKKAGFNTIICNNPKEGKKALSLGMYWIWDMYDYGIYDSNRSGYDRFVREYDLIKRKNPELLKKLLYFYWDNERYNLFDSVKTISDIIKSIDVDQNGLRYRPFFMQLDFSMANNNYDNEEYSLVDLQGGYANPMVFEDNDPQNYDGIEFKGDYNGEFSNFAVFDHLPGVKIPKTVFVINSPFGDKYLENTVFAALARGGKGFAFWRDGGSQPKLEKKIWWKDFPQLALKLKSLLPLIRMPHWTKWKIDASLGDDEDGIVVGTRDFANKECMIFASRSYKGEVVRFGHSGLLDDRPLTDYFTGKEVGVWKDGFFETRLPPRGYGVYCW